MIGLSCQSLFNIVQISLPEDWKQLVIYAAFMQENSCEVRYYVQQDKGIYVDCFNLDVDTEKLLQTIAKLYKEIANVHNKLEEKDRWNVVTVLVDADGNFKVEFDYSDDVLDLETYFDVWKEKYLEK